MKLQCQPYTVSILVNGKPIKEFAHEDNVFVAAHRNTEYQVRVQNHSHRRILAVPSIDGVNVIDGEACSFTSPGYVIEGMASTIIKGFRKDDNEVGAFKFCAKGQSYSEGAGVKGNSGVIGVAIFQEKYTPLFNFTSQPFARVVSPSDDSDTYNPHVFYSHSIVGTEPVLGSITTSINDGPTYDCNVASEPYAASVNMKRTKSMQVTSTKSKGAPTAADLDLGTTWGKKLQDSVVPVTFDREETPSITYSIYYASRRALRKLGVPVDHQKKRNAKKTPSAFPGEQTYATPPKNWKG
jgi:hypothetical protein